MQRAPPARSAGANLSAEDLQRRLLAIGNAAKARNPDGFVDELKRRVGPSEGDDDDLKTAAAPAAPPEAAASWFSLEPGTRLEKALARGAQVRPDPGQDGLYDPSHEAAGPPHPPARQRRLS